MLHVCTCYVLGKCYKMFNLTLSSKVCGKINYNVVGLCCSIISKSYPRIRQWKNLDQIHTTTLDNEISGIVDDCFSKYRLRLTKYFHYGQWYPEQNEIIYPTTPILSVYLAVIVEIDFCLCRNSLIYKSITVLWYPSHKSYDVTVSKLCNPFINKFACTTSHGCH